MMVKGRMMSKNKLIIWIAIAIAVIAAAIYAYYSLGPSVSAQGTASLKVQPDEVSVYLNIETRNASAQLAQNANSGIRDNTVNALKDIGINESDIKFGNYNIYPEYDWENGKQTMKGYVASQQIIVKIKDFSVVPAIIDASIAEGALISYINFELSDELQSAKKNIALEEAGKDAKTKAEASAAGVGKRLGRLVSVQASEFYYPGPVVYYDRSAVAGGASAESAAKQAALNLAPQDIDVSASISVIYKLRLF